MHRGDGCKYGINAQLIVTNILIGNNDDVVVVGYVKVCDKGRMLSK